MKPLKGVVCLVLALFLTPICYASAAALPQVKVSDAGSAQIVDSNGKVTSLPSDGVEHQYTVDGKTYKVLCGIIDGNVTVTLRPLDSVEITVKSPYPNSSVKIPNGGMVTLTFNVKNHALVVVAGPGGGVRVNGSLLAVNVPVMVNRDGTLSSDLTVAQNDAGGAQPGASSGSPDQPVPTFQDVEGQAGMGNNFFADLSINLNPAAATPVVPGQ